MRLLNYLSELFEKKDPKKIFDEKIAKDSFSCKFITQDDKPFMFLAYMENDYGKIAFSDKGGMGHKKNTTYSDVGGYVFAILDEFLSAYNVVKFAFEGADDKLERLYSRESFIRKVESHTGYKHKKYKHLHMFETKFIVSENGSILRVPDKRFETFGLHNLIKLNSECYYFATDAFFKIIDESGKYVKTSGGSSDKGPNVVRYNEAKSFMGIPVTKYNYGFEVPMESTNLELARNIFERFSRRFG